MQCPGSPFGLPGAHSIKARLAGRSVPPVLLLVGVEGGACEDRSQPALSGFHGASKQAACRYRWEDVFLLCLSAAWDSAKVLRNFCFCLMQLHPAPKLFYLTPITPHCIRQTYIAPVHALLPAMGTNTLLSFFLCLPGPSHLLPSLCSPSCFHHQLI